jgi:hypothetical protein
MQNLKDVFLLIALIKGLHERFHSLDQESLLTNSKACVMTKIIAFQTGKNREENFHPIYNAIEKLVNKHTLLRNAIPTSMVVKKAVQMKRVRFADETKTRSEISDEKRGCKPSLKKPSFELNNELINAKNYFLDKLLEYEKKRKNLIKLKKIKNDIDTALQEGRVIPFNARSLIYTDLTEDEKNAWYYYSYNQEYYYYHFFVNLLKRFIGNYQSAEEIMQPLYRIIAREKEQFKTDFEIMNAAREKYMQLHEEVEKRNLELKTAKLALKMQRKSLREKRKIIEEKKEIEVIVTKPPLTTKFSWWRHYISPFLKILTGAALGAGIGFGVGFLIGTLCGGLGVLISAPFLAVMGGLIGLIVSSHYACKNIDEEPRIPEECAECKESIVNIPTQNIHRNLKIKPQLQNNPEQKIEDIKLATHISPTHITPTATTHLGVIPTGRRW